MDAKEWKDRIRTAAEEAGTYQPFFDDIIDTLAGIMEKRDRTERQFEEAGGKAVIEHTNKGGNTNLVKNPLLVMVNDLNSTALAYWRDLGLTPSGFKKLGNDVSTKGRKDGSFEELLSGIGI